MDKAVPTKVFPHYRLWQFRREQLIEVTKTADSIVVSGSQGDATDNTLQKLISTRQKYEEQWDIFISEMITHSADYSTHKSVHDSVMVEADSAVIGLQPLAAQRSHGTGTSGNTPVNTSQSVARLKLPEIAIPQFSGEEEDWESFWAKFESLVHSRNDIQDTLKFVYLDNAIKGKAKKVISGYQVTAANYPIVVDQLKKHYEDPDRVRRNLCQQLYKLRHPRHDSKELRDFRIEYNYVLESLRQHNRVDDAAWYFVEMLLNKLHVDTLEFLFTYHKTRYIDLKQLNEGLEYLCDVLETGKKHNSNIQRKEGNHHKSSEKKPEQKSVWHMKANPTRGCVFCQEVHWSSSCPTYVTVEQRKSRLKSQRLCSKCSSRRHRIEECTVQLKCKLCEGEHWTGLHIEQPSASSHSKRENKPKVTGNTKAVTESRDDDSPKPTQVSKLSAHNRGVALPTAIVRISKGTRFTPQRTFFDIGSQKSFIHPSVLKELNIPVGNTEILRVSPFGGEEKELSGQHVILKTKVGTRFFNLTYFVTDSVDMQDLCMPGISQAAQDLKHAGIKLADPKVRDHMKDVKVVIGADYYGRFIGAPKTVKGVDLLSSPGGYLIYGLMPKKMDPSATVKTVLQVRRTAVKPDDHSLEVRTPVTLDEVSPEERHIKNLWELDGLGINKEKYTRREYDTLQNFSQTIEYKDNQYVVSLPFKEKKVELPTNYRMAIGQLQNLTKHLRNYPEKLTHYHKIIQEYEKAQFVERVHDSVIRGHYLPHHAVLKDSATTPIRLVFNASAKIIGQHSLNDLLETGPSLTEKLTDTLLNFRIGKYAICADISKAFLRVGLNQEDRDYVRFLWWENPQDPQSEIITYRFKSVLFGSTSSPFLLQATLQRHFEMTDSPVKDDLKKGFYADNFSTSTDDEEYLFVIHQEATKCLDEATMPLQEWNSNSDTFNSSLNDPTRKTECSMLGILWHTEEDSLRIKSTVHPEFTSITKRKALSCISEVFDPLGLVCPIVIRGKLLIRELWQLKKEWDEELDEEWIVTFNELLKCLNKVQLLNFPRRVCDLNSSCTIHVFCDASSQAYGAAIYIVQGTESNLYIAKSRVAPIRQKTIPQLELTAVMIGCRLLEYVLTSRNLQPENIYVWSDNTTCLHWIQTNKNKSVYVSNRVSEILDKKELHKFTLLYVNSKENPADILSRGCETRKLEDSRLWSRGPDWILDQSMWPAQPEILEQVETVFEIMTENIPIQIPEPIFLPTKYSSYQKLMNMTRKVYSFIQRCKPNIQLVTPITYWIKYEQALHYPLVLECLKLNSHANKYEASRKFINELALYLDENGLIRSKGRLSPLMQENNDLILLPPKGHLTYLLILQRHKELHHVGVADTLANLRETYWIPKGRQTVKNFISKCILCRMVKARTFPYPGPPPLPDYRVSYTEPFEATAVDFTGAIRVKDSNHSHKKYYICLFTCLATRAIHLELIDSLSAEAFIHCLRRFVARCSLPKLMVSDNGTNFVATYKLIKVIMNDPLVKSHLEQKSIKWIFSVPGSPWQGGAWERLVKSVKECMNRALFNKKLGERELRTIIIEIESILNNRPLTYVSSDEDLNICPAMLLYGRKLKLFPSSVETDVDRDFSLQKDNISVLVDYYKHVCRNINVFHKLWEKHYLPSLREKHYCQSLKPSFVPSIGEIVAIKDSSKNIPHRGRIVSVKHGIDGLIREVEVKIGNSIFRKTIDKLIPLNIFALETDPVLPKPSVEAPRLQREAAIKCKQKLKLMQ